MSIIIFHEDTYGEKFFRNILSINSDKKYKNIKYEKFVGKCNAKLTRKINATRMKNINKIIIIADADGNNINKVKAEINKHIPPNLKYKTYYVIFKYCIEELVCDGLGIKFNNDPIEALNNYVKRNNISRDYEKAMLPELAEKIDKNRLNNNGYFKKLLSYLQCKSLSNIP